MELSLLLLTKIIGLLLIVAMGFLSVKTGTVKTEHSTILSKLSFDWTIPCSLINAFITTNADDVMPTFLFTCAVTAGAVLLYIGLTFLLRRPLVLNPSEQASLMFTNSASMALPMTAALLGSGSVIYCAPHMGIQNLFIFTLLPWIMHGKGEGGWKKILTNRNLVAIFIGLFLFVTRIPLPGVVTDTIATVGASNVVFSMIMIGMLMGGVDFKELLRQKKIYLIGGLRLVIYPLIAMILIRITGVQRFNPEAGTALMVLTMCMASPVAALVTQMSDLYRSREEARESGSINVLTTMCCCITMPIMVFLYQLICL